jgi:hypothetical protein
MRSILGGMNKTMVWNATGMYTWSFYPRSRLAKSLYTYVTAKMPCFNKSFLYQ